MAIEILHPWSISPNQLPFLQQQEQMRLQQAMALQRSQALANQMFRQSELENQMRRMDMEQANHNELYGDPNAAAAAGPAGPGSSLSPGDDIGASPTSVSPVVRAMGSNGARSKVAETVDSGGGGITSEPPLMPPDGSGGDGSIPAAASGYVPGNPVDNTGDESAPESTAAANLRAAQNNNYAPSSPPVIGPSVAPTPPVAPPPATPFVPPPMQAGEGTIPYNQRVSRLEQAHRDNITAQNNTAERQRQAYEDAVKAYGVAGINADTNSINPPVGQVAGGSAVTGTSAADAVAARNALNLGADQGNLMPATGGQQSATDQIRMQDALRKQTQGDARLDQGQQKIENRASPEDAAATAEKKKQIEYLTKQQLTHGETLESVGADKSKLISAPSIWGIDADGRSYGVKGSDGKTGGDLDAIALGPYDSTKGTPSETIPLPSEMDAKAKLKVLSAAQNYRDLSGQINALKGPQPSAYAAPSTGIPTLTPEQVKASPKGTVFRTTDGRTMTVQ